MNKPQNIYFSGIGGVGIGPLAEIANDAGYTVLGSDAHASLTTRELAAKNISISYNQDADFLRSSHKKKPIDLFVHTAALPHDHPELLAAKELGIPTAKRDQLLARIIKDKNLRLIAIAGTHGKTTTTGMMVWAMQQAGIPVSYSVGSTLPFGPSGHFDKNSQYFVYECDEFDKNFLAFHPYLSLITSVDYDHPDTYPTEKDYKDAFLTFLNQSDCSAIWQADAQYLNVSENEKIHVLDNTSSNANGSAIIGEHNRRNASLVLWAMKKIAPGASDEWLDNFPGTNRRFEKLASNLYSDYGHHPVEIAATLQMASEVSPEIVLVYQPHQNVRQHEIVSQYKNQFELAEKVYWLPTYLSRENPNLEILSPQQLTKNLTNSQVVEYVEMNDSLWQDIQKARDDGKMVLAMGAGSIDEWLREQLANEE